MALRSAQSEQIRGLPAPLVALLYVGVTAAPLLLAALGGLESAGAWAEAATATGMIGGVMLILQLVSSGRFESLSAHIGIDVTMAFHKWAARLMVVLVLLHPLLIVAPIAPERPWTAVNHLVAMLVSPRYLSGVIALALVILIVALALLRDRLPLPYEAWRAGHGVMALVAVWATVHHLTHTGTYSDTPVLFAFWRVLAIAATATALGVYTFRAWRMRHQGWRIAEVKRVAERLWEIALSGGKAETLRFRAGQFAWLTFGARRFPLFDHPFSIASSPGQNELRFIVQEAGDFTHAIGSLPVGTPVGVDAPHGNFTLQGLSADAVLLVAGGVGIAPIAGILRHLAETGDTRPVRLVYGARSPAAMIQPEAFRASLDLLPDARAFFLADVPSQGWTHGVGPVTTERLHEALKGLDPSRVAAMVCGPGAMTTAVTDGLNALGVPYSNIRYERFDYASGAPSGKDRRIVARFWAMALAILAAGTAFAFR